MLPPELKRRIISPALELKLNPHYAVYKKFDVGSEITGIALNLDNTRALTVSEDKVARIWDIENVKVLAELKEHTMPISSVALSADGKIAATGSWDGTARVWDMNTGKLINTLKVDSWVTSVALSADGSKVLIGYHHGDISPFYNAFTGELISNLKVGLPVKSVALSADGKIALIGSQHGTAQVWNTSTGELLKNLLAANGVELVALSADGTIALIVTSNKEVLVLDTKSGALLNTLLTNNPSTFSVALSKNGERALVPNSETNAIEVWNTQPLAGQTKTTTPLRVLKGHTNPVMAVAFGGDNSIASGSYDGTALIWKPRESVTLK